MVVAARGPVGRGQLSLGEFRWDVVGPKTRVTLGDRAVITVDVIALCDRCVHYVFSLNQGYHLSEMTRIDEARTVLPSQRRYLDYFQQCLRGAEPVAAERILSRVELSAVPEFNSEGAVAFRPLIEVFANGNGCQASDPVFLAH